MKTKIFTLWLTGLSGAGKSTFAFTFKERFQIHNVPVVVLDGDCLRKGLSKDLGFSNEHRAEHNRRAAEVAKLLNQSGISVVAALISPSHNDRARAQEIISKNFFYEVYLNTPLSVCEQRDSKGLYKKARNNEIKEFTGIDAQYEAPKSPDFIVDYEVSLADNVNSVLNKLEIIFD